MFGYFGGFVLTPVYLETALGRDLVGDLADHDRPAAFP